MAQTFVFVGITEVGNELVQNLIKAGFTAAEDIASADFVFTYTPFLDDTEEVYFGSEGIISTAQPGTILINLAPTTPSLSHEIYALAQVSGMKAIEAPFVVHDMCAPHAFADRTNLTILVGGSEDDRQASADALNALGKHIVVCGEVGEAQVAKAAASLLRASAIVGLVEARALCTTFAGTRADMLTEDALQVTSAQPEIYSLYEAIMQQRFESSYSLAVILGEMVAALMAADEVNLTLPQAEAAQYLLQMLLTIGGDGMSAPALSLLYAEEAEGERFGLNWSRAEEMYEAQHHFHDEGCDHNHFEK